ncbi:MAG: DUF4384 domain-containing protein [Spirochaetia bacterium]|nr:DUF4384 domain-containing protein [Spirochaetia bacterium]
MIFFSAHSVFAQSEKIKIAAVIESSKNNNDTKEIQFKLNELLSNHPNILLIEREQLDKLFQEITLSQSGMIDESETVKIGKGYGAEVLVIGRVFSKSLNIKILHVETQKIIRYFSVNKKDLSAAANKITHSIEIYIARENLKRLRNESKYINLEFWIDKKENKIFKNKKRKTVRIGDPITFHFKSNQEGYITIVDIQPGGEIVILYPNDFISENKIKKNKIYSIPDKEHDFSIYAAEPSGIDTIVVFFSKKKVNWLNHDYLTGKGFHTVKPHFEVKLSRGFTVQSTKMNKNEWESKVIEIEVLQ